MMMSYFLIVNVLLAFLQSTGNTRYLLIDLDGDNSSANPGRSGNRAKNIIFCKHCLIVQYQTNSINYHDFSDNLGTTEPNKAAFCSTILGGAPCPDSKCDLCLIFLSPAAVYACCLACCNLDQRNG